MILYETLCILHMFADLSPHNPTMLLFDDRGSHLDVALVSFCKEKGIKLLLKPPHTTHRLHTCDVYNRRYFIDLFEHAKFGLFSEGSGSMQSGDSVTISHHAALSCHPTGIKRKLGRLGTHF